MSALVLAVLVASLLGSPHCAGMCGAVVALATCGPGARLRADLHCAYHGGRLITYALLGAICGTLGAMLDLGGTVVGLQRVAAFMAGALMVGFGLAQLMRLAGWRLPEVPVPGAMQRLVLRGHRFAHLVSPRPRALTLGLLTTLLPCGWLYAFALTAAGTASPLWGSVTMAVFWVGTLPVLIGVGVGVQRLSGLAGSQLSVMASVLLVVVGLATMQMRLGLDPALLDSAPPVTLAEQTERINELNSNEMPCCNDVSP